MAKKILVLSLGTGSKTTEADYPYRTANYRIGTEGEIVTAPFVADALIQDFKPDMILMIGTVKSAWGAFYYWYTEGNGAGCMSTDQKSEGSVYKQKIEEIEGAVPENGINCEPKEIDDLQRKINGIYENPEYGLQINGYSKQPEINVCLIRYGMNEDEMEDTYTRINTLWKKAVDDAKDDDIEVAFDITHSFRSMPIYNLVALNYYKQLSDKKIRISHVYYGNLDVARENNNIAQVVDLKDILNLMDFTNGASEFQNTGAVYSLKNLINDEILNNALTEYDWAVQTNDYNALEGGIGKILELTDENENASSDRTNDIQYYICEAIKDVVGCNNSNEWKNLYIGEKQLRIGQWFLRKEQYGRALVNGCEAMRSLLVKVDKKTRNDVESNNNENTKKKLYSKLKDQLPQILSQNRAQISSNEYDFWMELKDLAPKCQGYRNVFAHNLAEQENKADIIDDIKQYFALLEQLNRYINSTDATSEAIINAFNLNAVRNNNHSGNRTTKYVICGRNFADSKLSGIFKKDPTIYKLKLIITNTTGRNRTEAVAKVYESLKQCDAFDDSNNKANLCFVGYEPKDLYFCISYLKYRLLQDHSDSRAVFTCCDIDTGKIQTIDNLFITEGCRIPIFDEVDVSDCLAEPPKKISRITCSGISS